MLEVVERQMGLGRFDVGLGGSAVHHHEAFAMVVRSESIDVLAELLDHLAARSPRFGIVHIGEPADPLRRECGSHRLDCSQLFANRLQLPAVEHAGLDGGGVCVIRVGVPAAEGQIVELCQRYQVLDQRVSVLGSPTEPGVA